MIEIDEPIRRKRVLDSLGGIEETAFLRVGGETINGVPEADQDRTIGRGQGVVGAVRAFPVHRGADRRVFVAERRGGAGLQPSELSPYGAFREAVRAELTRDFG